MSLVRLIQKAQDSSEIAMLDIIQRFEPKLKKCEKGLKYEEAETDLIIALIETIQSFNLYSIKNNQDGAIVNYICNMLENKNIDLFRKFIKGREEELELNLDVLVITPNNEIEDKLLIEDLLSYVSKQQRNILIKKYLGDESDREIAKEMNISRQAVNQSKNRGLSRLKQVIDLMDRRDKVGR